MIDKIYIRKWSAWAPGLFEHEDWDLWAKGEKQIDCTKASPSLKHLPPVARRRLSQLTKMVLHVGHNLNDRNGQYPTIFCSQSGEITQQNTITRGLIDNGEVRPATFSLSVFNTPVSLLSIHEKNLEAATVQLSGEMGLVSGLLSLFAELDDNKDQDVLIIFADEVLPEDYKKFKKENYKPYSFGLLAGAKGEEGDICLELSEFSDNSGTEEPELHPLSFYKWFLSDSDSSFGINQCGIQIKILKSERC